MPPKRCSMSKEYEPSQLVRTQHIDRLPKPRAAAMKGKNHDGQLKVYLSGGALNSQTSDTQHFVFLEKEQDTAEAKADESNTYQGECRELRRRVHILEAALAAGGEELPDMPESQIPAWWRSDDEREADATATPAIDGDIDEDVADNAQNQSSSSSIDNDGEGDANAEMQMEYPEDNYERRMYETIVAGARSSVHDAKQKRLE
ncbi:hypothetical protein EWM64_g10434 [Hericium alpestre]|uniref:Uncharacterized protein n=1 Tax=Hericium alpestre TaxID=135208 RepID=A0A4Y9ZIM5_9AGAM|nr:hypothetical protein EWM64_g10434 [Hericium alpestre]